MFGQECFTCGMLPFACMCIEVCSKHRNDQPCKECENIMNSDMELQLIIDTCTIPFYKALYQLLFLSPEIN